MASTRQRVSASADGSSPQVSRRRRRHSERVRVTRACDRCKRRKIKCNGTQPCDFCNRAKANCTFDSVYARGRAPVIPSASNPQTVPGQSSANMRSDNIMTPSKSPSNSSHQYAMGTLSAPVRHTTGLSQQEIDTSYMEATVNTYEPTSSQDSPEPSQTDLEGHYVGPASGVSFLLRVQKRLHQAISFSHPSSIFTFGDAPLHSPDFDPSFCMMLPRDDAQRLVDRYFDFAMPTYRFLHRPTIQAWFEEFYDTLGLMREPHSAPAKVALLFMVFAQARVYMPDIDRPGPSDLSARYFLAAEHNLSKETGSITLTSVQARLTQCYYLLTQSRINHCWSLFGTVSHLALAIGLNRNRRPDSATGLSHIEAECRRRTFWCAYTLDAYLSAALGRPRTFHDEDMDAEFPACVDDHEIMPDHIIPHSPDRGPSIMLAPLAHIKIARIISKILRNLYSIRPISSSRRAVLTERISKELSDWRVELARFLDADIFSTSLLIPIFQRQRNVLNLTYWHAIMLTHRPYILSNFTRLSSQPRSAGQEDRQTQESVKQCLAAAMSTVNTIDDITRNRQMFQAFWITAYFAFNAVILLYIFVIQNRDSSPDVYSSYLEAATRCQSHLSRIAEKGSLSERYCLVLEELRVEALRQTGRSQPELTELTGIRQFPQDQSFQAASMPTHASSDGTNTYAAQQADPAIDFNGMPVASFADYSGWDQFFSMVSSGLGSLDP